MYMQMNILIFPNGFSMRAGMSENNDDDNMTLCIFFSWAKIILKWRRSSRWVDHSMKSCCKEFFPFHFTRKWIFLCSKLNKKKVLCVICLRKIFCSKTCIKFYLFGKKLCWQNYEFPSTSKLSLNIFLVIVNFAIFYF